MAADATVYRVPGAFLPFFLLNELVFKEVLGSQQR